MLLPIILIFVVAFGTLLLGRYTRSKFFKLITFVPFLLFTYFLSFLINVSDGTHSILFSNEWIPSLGISLDFKVDGLSLLFSLMITGIGTLVYLYASSYLRGHQYLHRFYCYLTLFMGAMLGLVLSDNLITLFVFWELTSISSFFLIGFKNEDEASRKSSLWALSLTGLGGFFLLASFVIIGSLSGTYSIHELLTKSDVLVDSTFYYIIIFFMFAAAFTKSAQFPFHFWLPGAMKAPTPVSAYLHSATMVKAGIYIIARFTPILSDGNVWNMTLMIVGGTTMFFGAFNSIFKTDMKSVLAYSTISALGVLVFLLGMGSDMALYAACTFMLVHALYKAALFLITGIVDHETHTRDLTVLSGLKKVMPIIAFAGIIASFSSAGIPLTFGFISKELIYGATMDDNIWTQGSVIFLTSLAVLTNILLAASGFLVGIKPFFGKLPAKLEKAHMPGFLLWLPPVLLSMASLLFGLLPAIADNTVIKSASQAVRGTFIDMPLEVWHGFSIVLLLSMATIVLGVLLYMVMKPTKGAEVFIEEFDKISSKRLVIFVVQNIKTFAFKYTRIMHNGYLRIYLLFIIVFFIGIVGYKLFADVPLRINTEQLSQIRIYELAVFIMIIVAIFFITYTSSRLTAIAALGVVGYSICLIFVFYGAPDLAMTQFAIDTLTVVLFVLVLFRLPSFLKFSNRKIQIRDAIIATIFGILISLITLQALVYPSEKEVSKFYADSAYTLAKGKNVVNVILVDFRGFDTLIETIVLSIAAIGVYSILKYKTKDGEKTE